MYEVDRWPFTVAMAPWKAVLKLSPIEGRLEVVELTLSRMDGGRIRAEDVHGFRLGAASTMARRAFAEITQAAAAADADTLGRPLSPDSRARYQRLAAIASEDAQTRKRPGRPTQYGLDHWQVVAEVYRKAYAEGSRPVEAVRKRFRVSRSTASAWVAEARRQEVLGPAPSRGGAGEVPRRKGRGKR